jgi:hypothetical protein
MLIGAAFYIVRRVGHDRSENLVAGHVEPYLEVRIVCTARDQRVQAVSRCKSKSTNSASPWKPSPPKHAATKNNSENSTAPTEPNSPHTRGHRPRATQISRITQTCGKIERFWQTLKKWLRAKDAPATLADLNDQLEQFRDFYNHQRPSRPARATPAEVFQATEKARPADQPLPQPVFVSRHTVCASSDSLCVPPYMVNVGRRWIGHICDSICDGNHIVIFSGTTLVRELTADPNRRYQPGQRKPGTHGKREPQPEIISVSDVPRHHKASTGRHRAEALGAARPIHPADPFTSSDVKRSDPVIERPRHDTPDGPITGKQADPCDRG